MAIPPWRLSLKPASYNGVVFHVETGTRSGGRRKVIHEFPKRDTPYLEDMGRRARRFPVTAYVIGPNYEDLRDALIAQLEAEANGQLVHPTYVDADLVGVDVYSVTERRERGGYAEFEISFIEAGQDISAVVGTPNTPSAVNRAVDGAVPTASANSGSDFSGSNDIVGGVGGNGP
jgi:prophage DNA circulation protein